MYNLVAHLKVSRKIERVSEIVATIAVLIGVSLFLSGLIFSFNEEMHHFVELFEAFLCIIFFLEIAIHFINAGRKRKFLKKNWFYIMTITPFTRMFGLLGDSARVARATNLLGHTKMVASEDAKMFGFIDRISLGLIRKFMISYYHLNRCEFDQVPKEMHITYINTYISPHAEKNIAKGILEGFKKEALRKMGIVVVYRNKPWIDAFRIEQPLNEHNDDFINAEDFLYELTKKSSDWGFVITDEKIKSYYLQTFGRMIMDKNLGFGVFSTKGINRNYLYEHIKIDYFMKLRGEAIAHHVLSEFISQEKGNTPKIMTPDILDAFALNLHIKNRTPGF